MSTIYDKSLLPTDRDRTIAQVVLTASGTVITTLNEPNVFHWQFYLPLSTPATPTTTTQAVVVDMIPVNPPTGCLLVSSTLEPACSAPTKIELPLAVVGSPTVKQFISIFQEKGMDRYKFDGTGSGCLWWVMTGVHHLEDAGLVEAGASLKLEQFHREHAESHPERHPMPLRKGEFYW
ncbi:hypothetical protein C2E23DRAFT_817145 [Lenzites betulinus]|nr:hypothetical protein C2E23DRAFT_817145 [Lenzites betulinus]